MKKILLIATVGLALCGLSSCSSVKHTSTAIPVGTSVNAIAGADLQVSPTKISYTYKPTKAVKRSGTNGVIQTAVAEALKANGNADVLVAPQYEITSKRRSIKVITVTGYPATYVNIVPAK